MPVRKEVRDVREEVRDIREEVRDVMDSLNMEGFRNVRDGVKACQGGG